MEIRYAFSCFFQVQIHQGKYDAAIRQITYQIKNPQKLFKNTSQFLYIPGFQLLPSDQILKRVKNSLKFFNLHQQVGQTSRQEIVLVDVTHDVSRIQHVNTICKMFFLKEQRTSLTLKKRQILFFYFFFVKFVE